MFAEIWGSLRGTFSQLIDAIAGPMRRAPLPQFSSPEQAAEYLMQNCQYTGDPLNGAIDFSYHPERLQWIMNNRDFRRASIDCDDYACWAYAALRAIPNCHPSLITLYGDNGAAHMICGYWLSLGNERVRYGVIDVNGHADVSPLFSRTILDYFNNLYRSQNVSFSRARESSYPF